MLKCSAHFCLFSYYRLLNFPYILNTNSSSNMCFVNIFSQPVACLFTLNTFKEPKFFILVKSSRSYGMYFQCLSKHI